MLASVASRVETQKPGCQAINGCSRPISCPVFEALGSDAGDVAASLREGVLDPEHRPVVVSLSFPRDLHPLHSHRSPSALGFRPLPEQTPKTRSPLKLVLRTPAVFSGRIR